ncbi:MAG: nucleotidyltransferase domain-containing protein [Promethearchaeota archaeon]
MTKSEKRLEVAREAARLLYYGLATEYIFAKKRAARSLRIRSLPSNKEVALELNNLADSLEGEEERKNRLVELRKEAYRYMKLLERFCPILKGSVWRGTITKRSDIDIVIYSSDFSQPLAVLNEQKIHPEIQYNTRQNGSISKTYVHLTFVSPSEMNVEIVIRTPEEQGKREVCEIFGDIVKGFTISELEMILKEDPSVKILPD